MLCPQCHTSVRVGNDRCPECGQFMPGPRRRSQSAAWARWACPDCGRFWDAGEQFCPECVESHFGSVRSPEPVTEYCPEAGDVPSVSRSKRPRSRRALPAVQHPGPRRR